MKNKLRVLKPEEIKRSYKYQIKKRYWNFYQEREFIENLCQHRFNYLIVVYTVFAGIFFSVDCKDKLFVLILGFIFIFSLFFLLSRAYEKLEIILQIIYALEDTFKEKCVFSIVYKEKEGRAWRASFPVNFIMGIIIPLCMLLSFIAGIITVYLDIWNP